MEPTNYRDSHALSPQGMPDINNMFLQDEEYQGYPAQVEPFLREHGSAQSFDPYQKRFGTAENQKYSQEGFRGQNIQSEEEEGDDFFQGFGKDKFFQVKIVSQREGGYNTT